MLCCRKELCSGSRFIQSSKFYCLLGYKSGLKSLSVFQAFLLQEQTSAATEPRSGKTNRMLLTSNSSAHVVGTGMSKTSESTEIRLILSCRKIKTSLSITQINPSLFTLWWIYNKSQRSYRQIPAQLRNTHTSFEICHSCGFRGRLIVVRTWPYLWQF